jgi:hypothetical protein
MQKTSAELDRHAEHLVTKAQAYAFTACQDLSLTNLDFGRPELDEAVETFTIHYLFPNVSEHERHLLMALRHARRGLWITLKAAERIPGKVPEPVIAEREHFYMDLKFQVDEMLPKLTPVQQHILQGPLFSIKW